MLIYIITLFFSFCSGRFGCTQPVASDSVLQYTNVVGSHRAWRRTKAECADVYIKKYLIQSGTIRDTVE